MLSSVRDPAIGPVPVELAASAGSTPGPAGSGTAAPVPLGTDLGSSASRSPRNPDGVPPGEGHEKTVGMPGMGQMAQAGERDARATGIVNSVNTARHMVNISHEPISGLGWPAMTMAFSVARSADLRAVRPGIRVNFVLHRVRGMYQIQSITPAGGER